MATNTVKAPLELFQSKFGGRLEVTVPKNPLWQPCWRWWLHGEQAAIFLKEIYPYLVVKKEPAELGLEYWALQSEFDKVRVRGRKLPDDEFHRRDAIRLRLKSLNSGKGPKGSI